MTMTKFSRINKQREEITMRVLEDMEKGGNEWKKPWVEASPLPPHNPVSGTQYSGRNFLYTYVYGMMRGYADPRWATEKQIKEMGWKIPENLQNGSADDKRGNRLHVGTGQKAQIYFDPESGEFIGKLKYVDDYIDLADGAKQHFELPRTAREYKPSDFSPKFPISNVKFEVDESVKDFIHVLPRGLFFYQNEFYDAVFGDKTDYPESLKDFLFTRTGDIEAAGEFYGAIEKWPQSVYCTLVEKCNVENRPIPEYENDRALPLDYHKELLASLKDYFGCGESNYRTPGDLIAARSYGSYLSGISLKFNPQDVIAAVEHATETVQAELVPYLSDSFGPDRYLPCGCQVDIPMNDSMVAASQLLRNLQNAGVDIGKLPNLSCDECSQLAAKVIPYAENKAQPAPDRTMGHKHEVNRDVAQRMQTERTTVNQIREEDTVGE